MLRLRRFLLEGDELVFFVLEVFFTVVGRIAVRILLVGATVSVIM